MPSIYSLNRYFISTESLNKNLLTLKHPKLDLTLCINLASSYTHIPYALSQWINPKIYSFSSIGEAKRILTDQQKLWDYYPNVENGRGKLIEEQLFPIKHNLYNFLDNIPQTPIGAWTLLNKNNLICSSATTTETPFGLLEFHQNKTDPPSRAYLKLWEFFTRTRLTPKKELQAIDFGASPGGWTWVLSSLFKKVTAVDRSPLNDTISSLKNVTFVKQDVMTYPNESSIEENAWIFSDVALDPTKIVTHLLDLKKTRPDLSLVCTLKLTNKSDFKLMHNLQKMDNSDLIHLSANKHELTWFSINRDTIEDYKLRQRM